MLKESYIIAATGLNNEVNVSSFHPHGPSSSYHLPHPKDELVIDLTDILTKVTPTINKTGQVYILSKDETSFASKSLCSFLMS